MDVNPADANALGKTVGELRQIHGDSLVAVALCGDAAGEAYRPLRTPLLLAVVVGDVTAAALRVAAGYVSRWRRRRVDVPMLFDPDYLASACDVFPLELLDLSDRHRMLHGDDVFASIVVDAAHVRHSVEAQLRGKLFHLCGAYLESGGARRALRSLLLEAPAGFQLALRGMLRLRDRPRPASLAAVIGAVEGEYGRKLPILQRLASARAGTVTLSAADLESAFAGCLDEIRALVDVIDAP